MSSYIRSWQVGDMIEWRGPYGNFSYTPNQVINGVIKSGNKWEMPVAEQSF